MSNTLILPSNDNFRAIDSIPVETSNRIRHASNQADAAVKIKNLNACLHSGDILVPATLTTTVAQTLDPSGARAFLIDVSGWTNTAAQYNNLTVIGGFPPCGLIDTNASSTVLPWGSIQVLNGTTSPVMPRVYLITDTDVLLTPATESSPSSWTVALDTIAYSGSNSYLSFHFSFYLYLL